MIDWLHLPHTTGVTGTSPPALFCTTCLGPTICYQEAPGRKQCPIISLMKHQGLIRKWQGEKDESSLPVISAAFTLLWRPIDSISRKPKESFNPLMSHWCVTLGSPQEVLITVWAMTFMPMGRVIVKVLGSSHMYEPFRKRSRVSESCYNNQHHHHLCHHYQLQVNWLCSLHSVL